MAHLCPPPPPSPPAGGSNEVVFTVFAGCVVVVILVLFAAYIRTSKNKQATVAPERKGPDLDRGPVWAWGALPRIHQPPTAAPRMLRVSPSSSGSPDASTPSREASRYVPMSPTEIGSAHKVGLHQCPPADPGLRLPFFSSNPDIVDPVFLVHPSRQLAMALPQLRKDNDIVPFPPLRAPPKVPVLPPLRGQVSLGSMHDDPVYSTAADTSVRDHALLYAETFGVQVYPAGGEARLQRAASSV